MSSPTESSWSSSSLLSTSSNDSSMIINSSTINGTCLTDLHWYTFLAPSFIYYFAGLMTIITFRIFVACLRIGARSPENIPPVHDDGPPPTSGRVTNICKRLTLYCERLVFGQITAGRLMMFTFCLFSILSFVFYLVDATNAVTAETCVPWSECTNQRVDFGFNIIFLICHFIRFVAAADKLVFLNDWNSIIDYLTIIPCFVAIYFERQWLGLRFLRAFGFVKLPITMQYLEYIKVKSTIRITEAVTVTASVFLAAAGFIHLLELPSADDMQIDDSERMTYFRSFYFIIDTASRVGLGDVTCRTTYAQAFTIVFIFLSLGMFTAIARGPLAEAIDSQQCSSNFYGKGDGVRHVVVCGHLTYESVSHFLADFLHEGRLFPLFEREGEVFQMTKCVFIDSKAPDLELKALFIRHFIQIVFIQGSIMNVHDLERVRLRDADACIILANQRRQKPDSEDAENIMRVMSAKTCHPNIRVIVQLLCCHNKSFCVNLPSWTSLDQALCLSELKLGSMAVGCLAPGSSTLLANLFVKRPYIQPNPLCPRPDLYLQGAGLEVYAQPFSAAFHGLPFPEANKICFIRLQLLLVAITIKSSTISSSSTSKDKCNVKVVLNPSHDVVIDESTVGYFICQSEGVAKQVTYFCPRCHDDQQTPGVLLQRCPCERIAAPALRGPPTVGWDEGRSLLSRMREKMYVAPGTQDYSTLGLRSRPIAEKNYQTSPDSIELRELKTKPLSKVSAAAHQGAREKTNRSDGDSSNRRKDDSPIASSSSMSILALDRQKMMEKEDFDSSAHFHWTTRRTFKESLLSSESNRGTLLELRDHVVVCCFGDDDTPFLGLVNFLMPLRASNLHRHELMPVVLLGDGKLLEREWHFVSQFPLVYSYAGSPLNQSDLRKVRTDRCRLCVILTRSDPPIEEPSFIDKESILCSLNVNAITFPPTAQGTFVDPQHIPSTSSAHLPTTSSSRQSLSLERDDEELLDVRENPVVAVKTFLGDRQHSQRSSFIPVLVELANDENVRFLDQDDDDHPDLQLYMTQPFASGRTFTVSLLDTLMSAVFFNPFSLELIRAFVTGGQETPRANDDDDISATAGDGSDKPPTFCQMPPSEVMEIRKRSRLTLLPLQGNSQLQPLAAIEIYGELVVEAMSQFGILCLGLYRRQIEESSPASAPATAAAATAAAAGAAGNEGVEGGEGGVDGGGFIKRRYVITNPPPRLLLMPSDEVYCLEPFPC